jgi:hypothetical protein
MAVQPRLKKLTVMMNFANLDRVLITFFTTYLLDWMDSYPAKYESQVMEMGGGLHDR